MSYFFEQEIREQAFTLVAEYQKEQQEHHKILNSNAAEKRVGTQVIVVSDKWSNPIVGVVKKIEYVGSNRDPRPVVFDYLTQKEYSSIDALFDYTEQRLQALVSLDPWQRWSLIIKERHCTYPIFNKTVSQDKLMTFAEIQQRLIETGFHARSEKREKQIA